MSEVVCRRLDCSYHSSSGFCSRPFVIMNPGGGCMQMYFANGQPRPVQWDKIRPKETIEESERWYAERHLREAEGLDEGKNETELQDAENPVPAN